MDIPDLIQHKLSCRNDPCKSVLFKESSPKGSRHGHLSACMKRDVRFSVPEKGSHSKILDYKSITYIGNAAFTEFLKFGELSFLYKGINRQIYLPVVKMRCLGTFHDLIISEIACICSCTESGCSKVNGICSRVDGCIKRLLAACRRKELRFHMILEIRMDHNLLFLVKGERNRATVIRLSVSILNKSGFSNRLGCIIFKQGFLLVNKMSGL